MTPEEILKMIEHGDDSHKRWLKEMLLPALELTVLQERSACAKIAKEAYINKFGMHEPTCEWIELAIRARGGNK